MAGRRKKSTKKAKPKSRLQRFILKMGWLVPIFALLASSGVLVFTYAFAVIPLPAQVPLESATTVYDVNGKKIGIFTGEQRRFLLNEEKLDELFKEAPHVGWAVVSAEDKDFYDHNGVSLRGLVRAAWANLTGGEIQQGGSTISQQYVKNAVLQDPSRTITRKFKEAILAIKLERRFSKRDILGFYLNTIYLGRGAYGIEAAARAYFKKNAVDLTIPEAAYLASIIPSPESYQPQDNMKEAVARRNNVITVMRQEGYIDARQARNAKKGKVDAVPDDNDAAKHQKAAYFMEWLRDEYLDPLLGNCLYTCGLKIHTTLDLEAQQAAEEALGMTHEKGWPEAALVAMTPRGDVRAMVGGKSYNNVRAARGFNYATTHPGRQPGSAFKPFTLITAIEQGISPDSRFSGASPATITDEDCANGTEPWQPENYGGSSYGTVDLEYATANSINTVYAQLIAETGPEAVADNLDDFGFRPEPGKKQITPYCSLALGGAIDVTPLEMARAYATFNARGEVPEVNPVTFIRDNDDNCIDATGPASIELAFEKLQEDKLTEVVPRSWADCPPEKPLPGVSTPVGNAQQADFDVANQVMTNVTSGTAVSANLSNYAYIESGKTGTTQENRDAWFAGSVPSSEESPGLTTVVWMGYPLENPKQGRSYTPLMRYCEDPELCRPVGAEVEVTGGSYPAQMWAAFMNQAIGILDIAPASWPEPAEDPDEVINSPPPTTDPTTFVPAPPESETPSEEPTESEPPSSKPPPPPTTSEPPPPPPTTSEPPPPPTSPPATPPGRRDRR